MSGRTLPVLGARGGGPAGSAAVQTAAPAPPPEELPHRDRAVDRSAAPGDAERPADTAELWSALEEVDDPELPVSVVDLGLVYDVRRERTSDGARRVVVELTFTAMGCPCVAFIREDVTERLLREDTVDEVRIEEVWHPAWSRERMTQRGRARMREFGVSV